MSPLCSPPPRPPRQLGAPPVALPLKLRESGGDAWVEDADGVTVIATTRGFKSEDDHEDWCRWVVQAANAQVQTRIGGTHE